MNKQKTIKLMMKKAMSLIHSKYGIKEVSVTKTDSIYSTDKVRGQHIAVGNVRDSDYQYNLIEEVMNLQELQR